MKEVCEFCRQDSTGEGCEYCRESNKAGVTVHYQPKKIEVGHWEPVFFLPDKSRLLKSSRLIWKAHQDTDDEYLVSTYGEEARGSIGTVGLKLDITELLNSFLLEELGVFDKIFRHTRLLHNNKQSDDFINGWNKCRDEILKVVGEKRKFLTKSKAQ